MSQPTLAEMIDNAIKVLEKQRDETVLFFAAAMPAWRKACNYGIEQLQTIKAAFYPAVPPDEQVCPYSNNGMICDAGEKQREHCGMVCPRAPQENDRFKVIFFQHKHGTTATIHTSEEGVQEELYEWVQEYITDLDVDDQETLRELIDAGDKEMAIKFYFDVHCNDTVEIVDAAMGK